MSTTICTGTWGANREQYSGPFLETMARHLPREINLVIYSDEPIANPAPERFERRDMPATWRAFVERHSGDPIKCGRAEPPGRRWKDKERRGGYSFKWDAVRFAGQGFVPEDAAGRLSDGDVLVWLDADVVALRDIPADFFERLLGDEPGAYLGRPKHSEIGYWSVRLDDMTRELCDTFADFYQCDALFQLGEWHSAFVWDESRISAEENHGRKLKSLPPAGMSGHVWMNTPLVEYLDHLKGDRKKLGRSPERRGRR